MRRLWRRIVGIEEREEARRAKTAFSAALVTMQPELPHIQERGQVRDRSGRVQTTYALWEDINTVIKPVLERNGFALTFRVGRTGGRLTVTAILTHRAGHSEQTSFELPPDHSGGKNPLQALGSSTSYGKRYTAAALLNLTSKGEDDDGRDGGRPPTITDDQVAQLRQMIEAAGATEARLLGLLRAESLEMLPTERFEAAKAAIVTKAALQ